MNQKEYYKNLPKVVKSILESRNDLLDLKFDKITKEKELLIWLISSGNKEYPYLFDLDKNTDFNIWLSDKVLFEKDIYLPRIIFAVWNSRKKFKRRWPKPHLDDSFFIWLKSNWNNLDLGLPKLKFFKIEINSNKIFTFGFLINLILYLLGNLNYKKNYFFYKNDNKTFFRIQEGLRIQRNVISALIYRELKTRLSQVKFGIFGIFIEPIGVIAVFLLIFGFLRGTRTDLDTSIFLSAGIILYTMFNEISIRSLKAMTANEALFFYREVKPIDTVIARTVVETGLYSIVFIVIIFSIFLLKEEWILDDFPKLVIAFLSLVLSAFGFGLVLLVAGHRYPSLHQIVPLLLRPLWFISGVFFSISTIPQSFRSWISWNPIIQAIEITRNSFSQNYRIDPQIVSLPYLIWFGLIITCVGLWIYNNNEKLLLTR